METPKGHNHAKAGSILPLYDGRADLVANIPVRVPKLRTAAWAAFVLYGLLWLNARGLLHYPNSPEVQATARNPAYLIKAKHGAVASENKRCSEIGVNTLKKGGNAVDAAVAATFCTGVVNMFSSGIGGGGFMTIRIPPSKNGSQSEVYTIDFREIAPSLSNKTMYSDDPKLARYGGLSVGVPGEVMGLEEAHKRWGRSEWKDLMQPSIQLAQGWRVDTELSRRIPWYSELLLNDPDWKPIFAPHGELLKEGEMIRRTNYSRTLKAIAAHGSKAFYEGPIADAIVHKVRATGGILSHEDLKNYTVNVKPALEGTYRDKKVYTTHAPTSGPVLLHILNLMEEFDLSDRTVLNTHRLVEALKFGFAARTKICDPDPNFNDDPDRINDIATKDFARRVRHRITDDHTNSPDYYKPEFEILTDHGTSHTSIVDQDDMAVAITSTVNLIFGSRVLDPETGILFNDEMDDFSIPGVSNEFGLRPSPYNYPQPGKRPLSSTSPTILENADGSFYVALGGSGGSRIFGSVFQTILNMDWGLDASQAVEFGRLHDQLYPSTLDADNVYPWDLLEGLRERGHNLTISDVNRVAAVVQVVSRQGEDIFAASDSRKNGIAVGY
ncbi:gamma-glutamyltranspeptidase [Pluteus cervinus]|uniref:Gamma-glutamyltranspeptidase n=1 Tax=Pluteus cervinus TaxID=181527 RepID=A0ACD3B7H9_9AGAR|nr:gamma-glutamyltranspeptidase [Pluteus cervinus]